MPFPQVAAKHFPKAVKKSRRIKEKMKKFLKNLHSLLHIMGISPRAWALFFWLNVFRRNTASNLLKMQVMVPTRYCVFDVHPSAKIILKGRVVIGGSKVRGSKLETRIHMEKETKLVFNDVFYLGAGADIQIFKGGILTFEGGPAAGCNIHSQMVCADSIHIGRSTLIGRNVVLRDYDAHYIIQKGYKVKAPITIGAHCWIGEGALISKGVSIGDGSIVAARSWVISKVAEKTLVAGSPAMPVSENIEWRV